MKRSVKQIFDECANDECANDECSRSRRYNRLYLKITETHACMPVVTCIM